tara:strand:+ start:1079 stop:1513 length:435 start_codon:yes stop_codon:yes gene_type:complete
MAKYKTAKQLGILPEEHKALVAFVKAPVLGRTISVNGHAHYYDQELTNDRYTAKENECGTAGCVAGFVLAHVQNVQKKRKLRGYSTPWNYIEAAWHAPWNEKTYKHEPVCPILYDLYSEVDEHKLAEARRVVDKMLKTGRVDWK